MDKNTKFNDAAATGSQACNPIKKFKNVKEIGFMYFPF